MLAASVSAPIHPRAPRALSHNTTLTLPSEMDPLALGYLGAGLGAGLILLGAGLGIGRLAAAALEGSARQPEAAGDIRTTMIIAAALIEGAALFGLVVCILMALRAPAGL